MRMTDIEIGNPAKPRPRENDRYRDWEPRETRLCENEAFGMEAF